MGEDVPRQWRKARAASYGSEPSTKFSHLTISQSHSTNLCFCHNSSQCHSCHNGKKAKSTDANRNLKPKSVVRGILSNIPKKQSLHPPTHAHTHTQTQTHTRLSNWVCSKHGTTAQPKSYILDLPLRLDVLGQVNLICRY